MPLVEIEIVLKPGETIQPTLASELADRLGEVFGSPQGGTWVKVYGLTEDQYAENGGKEEELHPVFVSVLKSRLPAPDDLQLEAVRVTSVVAQACRQPPENIHVIYLPAGHGRVAFGGKIVS